MTQPGPLRAGILIVSDTASKNPGSDQTAALLRQTFAQAQLNGDGTSQWDVAVTKIVPDNALEIQRIILRWCDGNDPLNLVLTSGGTGFAVGDVTPEAVAPLLHRHAPGLVQGMLAASLAVTPFAMMSRPVAGVRNKTIILTLPGSPKGARENLEAVVRLLPHACTQAAGSDSRVAHSGGVRKLEQDAGLASPMLAPDRPRSTQRPASHDQVGGHRHQDFRTMSPPSHDHHRHQHQHGHKMPVRHTDPSGQPISNDPNAGPSRRHRSSPYPMVSVEEALKVIEEHSPRPEKITVPLGHEYVIGRVLAEPVKARESVPAFRASIVDGYAIKMPSSSSFKQGVYPVASISHAQAGKIPPLEEDQVARITTGAPLPPGADAVVMVEDTVVRKSTSDGSEEVEVEILTSAIQHGENVREIGSDVAAGTTIMHAGEGISASGGEFGFLASVGTHSVTVFRAPIVGVLSTGNELVPHHEPRRLLPGEVRDTNRPTLLSLLRHHGFEPVDLGIAPDDPTALESTLRSALSRVDTLITTGGVSMGETDLLKPTLERALGAKIHFGRVAMKPGKPTTFATVPAGALKDPATGQRGAGSATGSKTVFALPGNPASAAVTFAVFVRPLLRRAAGISPVGLPRVEVRLEEELKRDRSRMEYQRGVVSVVLDGGASGSSVLVARSTGGQRSSRIGSFKGANALLIVEAGEGVVRSGEMVEALMIGELVGLA